MSPFGADPLATRLDQVLAELETLGDARLIKEFAGRAAAVAAEVSVGQRRLLADSLILDAGAATRRLRGIAATHLPVSVSPRPPGVTASESDLQDPLCPLGQDRSTTEVML